jgi:membrane protein YdbS with pleckstrin-like domain
MPDLYRAPAKKREISERYSDELKESKAWWKAMIDEVLKNVGETPRSAALGAYCVRPTSSFVTQQEDEEIVLLLRAHPIVNIPWMILAVLMFVFPMVLLNTGIFAEVPGKYIFMGKATWYLMLIMFILEKILYWFYSVFIVTNERLVDIDFYNLMYRMITYANLNHIEEPASTTGGFIRSLFQYGNVWVTTASEKPTVEALNVPYPDKVVDIISRLSEELEKRREQGK